MKEGRAMDKVNDPKVFAVPLVSMAKSASDKSEEVPGDEKSRSSRRRKQKQRRKSRDHEDKDDREPKATFNGKRLTLRMYTLKRRFNFLHLYSGKDDPLGSAIRRLAKNNKMKVNVVSCEKDEGVDLLRERPYGDYLNQAKDRGWDGMHSGFPCTSFSRLRWRKAEGYPGPVRSKKYPYGIPGIPRHRQEEADEGTLHASRTAHLGEAILKSGKEDKIKPFVTVENPPPSDHPEHLSAWELAELRDLVESYNFIIAQFPTCRFQTKVPLGERTCKPQQFAGTLPGLEGLEGRCLCGDADHIAVVGKQRSVASGRYPDELCEAYAALAISQFKRMAKAEFYTARAKELDEEVRELRERTDRKRALDPRPPLQRPLKARREAASKVKAAAASQGKPESKSKAKADEDEYTYEYFTEDEESEQATKDEVKSEEDTKVSKREKHRMEDWKGGRGKFGLLRESGAKSADPSKLNYLAGMRNPAEVTAGMPKASGSLRLGKGRPKATLRSKWIYKSPVQEDIVSAWTAKAADPDTKVAKWIEDGTPLGINVDIVDKGIFPPADKEAEQEILNDALSQMSRGTLSNYTSVQENLEDAKEEVKRLEKLGFLVRISEDQVRSDFSQGTISRLALIVKERPDKTKKRRLIIDLRRSGGNSKSRLGERLALPRVIDAVQMMRSMVRAKMEVTQEEAQEMWKRELLLIDVSDAFPHLAVHHKELEHCVTPGLAEGEYFLFRALLFGFKTAPLLWSRTAAWMARALQACVPHHEGQHQVYLDDSLWMVQGTLNHRNMVVGFVLYTMSALGFTVSVRKGERGSKVTWMGVEFRLLPDSDLLVTLPEKFLAELQQRVSAWETKGMAATKELRMVCGKLSWLSGVLPRTRWMLRVFYAVLAQRDAEITSGAEESRRTRRTDDRSKEHLFVVKRLEGARLALMEYLNVTKERPTRKISLRPRDKAKVSITSDASPEGLGAILIVNGQVIDAIASPVTEVDAKDLMFQLGDSSSQGTVEALAIVVALVHWNNKLAGMSIDLTIQADSGEGQN
eukprot:s2086_g16.t1